MYGKPKTKKMIDSVKKANSKPCSIEHNGETFHFNSLKELVKYSTKIVEKEVDYDPEKIPNIERSVAYYIFLVNNNIIPNPQQRLKPIYEKIKSFKIEFSQNEKIS